MSSATRIKDIPEADRPRERLARLGADALSTAELIAILLRTGLRGTSAIEVANQMLKHFEGSLEKLARASVDDLCQIDGVGRDKAVTLKAAFTLAQRMVKEQHHYLPLLDTPEKVADYLREDHRFHDV